ncbi:MAG: BamA/TamA family outer membrane protein [Rhodothermales bacterium]|nr:BamA/TamA family outer membrane protein [Rhodothermales bacterium]
MRIRLIATFLAFSTVALASPLSAQEFNRPEPNQFLKERSMIETLLGSIVELVENAATLSTGSETRSRLTGMTNILSANSKSFRSATTTSDNPDLEQTLRDALAEIQALRSDLSRKGDLDTSRRLEPIEDLIEEALDSLSEPVGEVRAADEDFMPDVEPDDEPDTEFLEPGVYTEGDRSARQSDPEDRDRPRWWNDNDEDSSRASRDWDDWRQRRFDDYDFIDTYVGEFTYRWPFRESGIYRTTPAIRYNRVEGLVLGVRREPLEWDGYERARIYGMGGYAFGSDDWQYEIGAEARASSQVYKTSGPDLKIGGSYRRATYTNDLWKSTWSENSLAAFFFNYDFFDYYMVEGWTAYATAKLNQYVQITGAYRDEDYSSLEQNITWSLFGGDNFRFNFPVDSLSIQSVNLAVDAGRVSGLNYLPDGVAFRAEAELGKGFGDDYSFNRFTGDLRTYMRVSSQSSVGVRLRAGVSEGDMIPIQKMFTIGGIGSVRAYPQNVFFGDRIVVANAEYAFVQNWFWDELLITGFFDAGWTSTPSDNQFSTDDLFKSVGVSLGLFDRVVRLDLAFPLDDFGGDKDPTLWLRLAPAF